MQRVVPTPGPVLWDWEYFSINVQLRIGSIPGQPDVFVPSLFVALEMALETALSMS